jgi:hypothetical protein
LPFLNVSELKFRTGVAVVVLSCIKEGRNTEHTENTMTNDNRAMNSLNLATAAREAMQAVLDAAGEGHYGNMSRTRAVARTVHGPRNTSPASRSRSAAATPAAPALTPRPSAPP